MGEEILREIIQTGSLGNQEYILGKQLPQFKNMPLVYASYLGKGYNQVYTSSPGITFETDSPVVYAGPTDNFNLMRGGRFLPGHEKFVFQTIEEMLRVYPTVEDFKQSFQDYFKTLKFYEIYPDNSRDFAEVTYRLDYCLRKDWNPGCNEVTFRKPLKIKNPRMFKSVEELKIQ
jgi:hypothetical protein